MAEPVKLIQMMNMGNEVFHYHCFMGLVAEAKELVRNVPAIIFGISPKAVGEMRQKEVIHAILGFDKYCVRN